MRINIPLAIKVKHFFSGNNLQKKWRNIRDCFVKAHKAKKAKSESVAKKKPYRFYNKLLFLKDTISVDTTTSIVSIDTKKK